jgi:hypothetical protein
MAEKILALIAGLMLFFVVGFIGYQELGASRVVVDVQLKQGQDPFQAIKTLVPEGTAVIEVKEIDRAKNIYQMTVRTHRKKTFLLEWMRRSERVERADESVR